MATIKIIYKLLLKILWAGVNRTFKNYSGNQLDFLFIAKGFKDTQKIIIWTKPNRYLFEKLKKLDN